MRIKREALPWYGVWWVGLIGLGVTMYLTAVHFAGDTLRCDFGDGCESVVRGDHAVFLGLPAAVLGDVAFLILVLSATVVIVPRATSKFLRTGFILLVFLVSIPALVFSAYSVSKQALELHAYCAPCILASGVMALEMLLGVMAWVMHRRTPVWIDDVMIALRGIGVSDENADDERRAQRELALKLGRSFNEVRAERSIPDSDDDRRIDIDIDDWSFGIELKRARALDTGETDRLITQVRTYGNEMYGHSLIVGVIGRRDELGHRRLKRSLDRLDEEGIPYVKIPVFEPAIGLSVPLQWVDWGSVSDWCWRGVSLLSLVGLGVATYLSVVYVSGQGPGCGEGGGCGIVVASSYALLFGIPVAMIGVAGYSAILLGSLAVIGLEPSPVRLRQGLLAAAGFGVLFSGYFTATQAFFIHAFCTYCLISASLMTVILLLMALSSLAGRLNRRVLA